ncbi:hypothetical protein TWF730_007098 [Orbilia blumenaviensis]|uniref:F-box domain-containing protein n=1 Tax=Orbilia blumenaviensis TaxID=1796055 RepID=A0AAV9VGQ5_9PEZI
MAGFTFKKRRDTPDAAPEKPALWTLPAEMVDAICSFLDLRDRLNLRLVSKSLLSRMPPVRGPVMTLLSSDIGPAEIARLESLSSGERVQVEHLIIDFSAPNLYPIELKYLAELIFRYPSPMVTKIDNFCSRYRSGYVDSTGTKLLSDTTPVGRNSSQRRWTWNGNFTAHFCRKFSSDHDNHDNEAPVPLWRHVITPLRPLRSRRHNIMKLYRILSCTFPKGGTCHKTRWTAAHYNSLTKIFSLLPKLRILEFRDSNLNITRVENKLYRDKILLKAIPALAYIMKVNPALKSLPWQDWLKNAEDTTSDQVRFVYPGIMVCAAQANSKISQIRLNTRRMLVDDALLLQWLGERVDEEDGSSRAGWSSHINSATEAEVAKFSPVDGDMEDIFDRINQMLVRCRYNDEGYVYVGAGRELLWS